MHVFANGGMSPALAIGSLEGDLQEGQRALVGPGAFANFKVTPGAVGGLAAAAEKDPAADDQHLVRSWKLSPSSPLPDGREPAIGDLPKAPAEWRPLSAERGGLVNVTRVYGNPLAPPARSVTWLKTSITSTKSQSKKVAIGWTREIWVFVNGQRVYADKNLFQLTRRTQAAGGPPLAAERIVRAAVERGRERDRRCPREQLLRLGIDAAARRSGGCPPGTLSAAPSAYQSPLTHTSPTEALDLDPPLVVHRPSRRRAILSIVPIGSTLLVRQ